MSMTYSKRRRKQKKIRKLNMGFGLLVKKDSFLNKRKKRPTIVNRKSGLTQIY